VTITLTVILTEIITLILILITNSNTLDLIHLPFDLLLLLQNYSIKPNYYY